MGQPGGRVAAGIHTLLRRQGRSKNLGHQGQGGGTDHHHLGRPLEQHRGQHGHQQQAQALSVVWARHLPATEHDHHFGWHQQLRQQPHHRRVQQHHQQHHRSSAHQADWRPGRHHRHHAPGGQQRHDVRCSMHAEDHQRSRHGRRHLPRRPQLQGHLSGCRRRPLCQHPAHPHRQGHHRQPDPRPSVRRHDGAQLRRVDVGRNRQHRSADAGRRAMRESQGRPGQCGLHARVHHTSQHGLAALARPARQPGRFQDPEQHRRCQRLRQGLGSGAVAAQHAR